MKKKTLKELTRISDGLNLGPKSEKELNAIGINSLEQMREMGWEEVCLQYIYSYPKRLNLNMVYAVIGAIHGVDWRHLSPPFKESAFAFIETLRKK